MNTTYGPSVPLPEDPDLRAWITGKRKETAMSNPTGDTQSLLRVLCFFGIHRKGTHYVNYDGQITADCKFSHHRIMVNGTGWGKYS